MKYLISTLIFFSFLFSQGQSNPDDLNENEKATATKFEIKVLNKTVLQRSFLIHKGIKKTHIISVGTPSKINYSYDLSQGTLLQVWKGKFLDATKMWKSRGEQQLAIPIEKVISIHGTPDFSILKNNTEKWPSLNNSKSKYKQLGYEIDSKGNPEFRIELNGNLITNSFEPLQRKIGLKRIISTISKKTIWHKVAEGDAIKKIKKGSYEIKGEYNYVVKISKHKKYKTTIRKSSGKEELLVEIPSGNQKITYTILW